MLSDYSRYRRIFILVFVIVLVACSKHKPVPPPIVHINPSPQQNYVVTMRVDDSISDISNVEVVNTYEISNIRECSPIDYTFSMGGSHRPQSKKSWRNMWPLSHMKFLQNFLLIISKTRTIMQWEYVVGDIVECDIFLSITMLNTM